MAEAGIRIRRWLVRRLKALRGQLVVQAADGEAEAPAKEELLNILVPLLDDGLSGEYRDMLQKADGCDMGAAPVVTRRGRLSYDVVHLHRVHIPRCDTCHNLLLPGVLFPDGGGYAGVARCDTCGMYADDDAAAEALEAFLQRRGVSAKVLSKDLSDADEPEDMHLVLMDPVCKTVIMTHEDALELTFKLQPRLAPEYSRWWYRKKYHHRVDALMRELAELCNLDEQWRVLGLTLSSPPDFRVDESGDYRWEAYICRGDANLGDVVFSMLLEENNDGVAEGQHPGITFTIYGTSAEGQHLIGAAPHNHTPGLWVPRNDPDAVEERFGLIEKLNHQDAPKIILDNLREECVLP